MFNGRLNVTSAHWTSGAYTRKSLMFFLSCWVFCFLGAGWVNSRQTKCINTYVVIYERFITTKIKGFGWKIAILDSNQFSEKNLFLRFGPKQCVKFSRHIVSPYLNITIGIAKFLSLNKISEHHKIDWEST